MLSFSRPSESRVQAFLARQERESLSYGEALPLDAAPPPGYTVDHNRVLLGVGRETYRRAVAALDSWRHFELTWCRVYPSAPAIEIGSNVVVVARHFGFWSLNPCRVVHVVDEESELHRHGFAYGTLGDHMEMGQERFLVEWNASSQEVHYDILAFSRPRNILARLGYPLTRWLQRRFAEGSKRAMVRAVESAR